MDVALALDALVPEAQYTGSLTTNTKQCFDDLNWQDERKKPTWKQVQDAYETLPEKLKNYKQFQIDAKAAAQAKLATLGLTTEDLKALGL